MSFVVYYDRNGRTGYVEKREGTVHLHDDPRKATQYADKDDAERGKVGHHRDMGGDGFFGRIVAYQTALQDYYRRERGRHRHWG